MPHDAEKHPNPADLLRISAKFLNWNPSLSLEDLEEPSKLTPDGLEQSNIMGEQHYTPADLAKMWGVSVQTIRELFKDEEGVLKIGSDGTRNRRAYKTLRIPHSIAERVHTRLSA
jgi:hypothetical protein